MTKFSGLLLLFSFQTSIPAQTAVLNLDSTIKNGKSVEFLKFSGPGAFDSYLTMNLPFAPMKTLLQQVQTTESVKLKDRGEAHITVVTPVEFWNDLKPYGVSIAEIDQIAEAMNIQNSAFQIICLGAGKKVIEDREEKTFYVVVQSDDLLKIRRKVQELLLSKEGGRASNFNPTKFYSHITLGYTLKDLHDSDGIIKDDKSCIHDIQLVN
ncbi:MAG: hypothetical protein V4736_00305 [Bdellovibrionota bacterium]